MSETPQTETTGTLSRKIEYLKNELEFSNNDKRFFKGQLSKIGEMLGGKQVESYAVIDLVEKVKADRDAIQQLLDTEKIKNALLTTQLTNVEKNFKQHERMLDDCDVALPLSFYSDRQLCERVKLMVDGWRNAVNGSNRLEDKVDELHSVVEALTSQLKDLRVENEKLKKEALVEEPPSKEMAEVINELSEEEEERYDCEEIACLIGEIFTNGNFKAETYNERKLERLLRKWQFYPAIPQSK